MVTVIAPPLPRSAPPQEGSRPEIGTLTALRFVAALWVVLFHLQAMRHTFLAPVYDVFRPVITYGDLGVDVFFVLSGFIITYTYLERLGPRLSWRGTRDFVWARFARMWPAFALVVGVLGLWFAYGTLQQSAQSWSLQTKTPDLSLWGLAKQLLMVHLWFQPGTDGASWFGPGWTVSAEWLAYLAFPLLALVLFRLRRLHPLAALAGSVLVLLPATLIGPDLPVATGEPLPYEWLLRIFCCFTAGALGYIAARNADRMNFNAVLAGPGAVLTAAAVVVFLAAVGKPGPGRAAVLAFPLIVALLSLARGWVRSALSARWLQYGGRTSYSLYLVHMFFVYLFYWLHTDWLKDQPVATNVLAAGCLIGIAAATHLLFTYVEEPARKRLRGLIPRRPEASRRAPAAPAAEALPPRTASPKL